MQNLSGLKVTKIMYLYFLYHLGLYTMQEPSCRCMYQFTQNRGDNVDPNILAQ